MYCVLNAARSGTHETLAGMLNTSIDQFVGVYMSTAPSKRVWRPVRVKVRHMEQGYALNVSLNKSISKVQFLVRSRAVMSERLRAESEPERHLLAIDSVPAQAADRFHLPPFEMGYQPPVLAGWLDERFSAKKIFHGTAYMGGEPMAWVTLSGKRTSAHTDRAEFELPWGSMLHTYCFDGVVWRQKNTPRKV